MKNSTEFINIGMCVLDMHRYIYAETQEEIMEEKKKCSPNMRASLEAQRPYKGTRSNR